MATSTIEKPKTNLRLALRPRTLEQVIGHDDIKPALKKFIDQECKQWLFHGFTGTGKTSLAFIVAHALQGSDSNDDIMELDGASFRTASDMRELLEKIISYPMVREYRVIIMDEAHCLTKEAKALLLKPLEQEESRNVWILCTSNVGELDKALRDRCVQFQLKPMGPRERRELVSRAVEYTKYPGDTSKFLRKLDTKNVESARDILGAFEKLCNGMSAEEAIGE